MKENGAVFLCGQGYAKGSAWRDALPLLGVPLQFDAFFVVYFFSFSEIRSAIL